MMAQPGFEQETFKTLLEGYLSQLNQADALQKVRAKAWDHFLELGLPTRSTEAYRYIKLRQLFAKDYQLAETHPVSKKSFEAYIYPECQQSVLIFVNGDYRPDLSQISALPSNMFVTTLSEAMRPYGAFLNNYWAKSIKEESDAFAALNTALHRQGAFVYIPPKTIVEAPLQVLHVIQQNDGQALMLMPRLNVFVGAQSQVQLVASRTPSQEDSTVCINQVVDIILEEAAHAHYTQVLMDHSPTDWHFDALRSHLKKYATLKTVAVTEGSATIRTDYRVSLGGENAEALLNGVWMLGDKREAHSHVFLDHQAPSCRSYQLFKGVLNDFSRSSFEGKIMVRQIAQKTEAFQLNNNLLLNDHCHADSKPNLEIFADDVKASHGATIGQLDPEQLFYMKTRGLAEQTAKNLLIYGFCEQVIEMINLSSLKEKISDRARKYLI